MKKIVLSMMVAGSLLATSCKGEKKEATDALKEVTTETEKLVEGTEKEAVKLVEGFKKEGEELVNKVDSALEGVSIPKFENAEVTKHLESYATYAKEYIAAKGDVLKNAKLAKEGVELAKKGKELLATLNEESAKKFKSVMSAIQSKMAPAN